jgi:uncharacterized membrane protein YedE/YeeE
MLMVGDNLGCSSSLLFLLANSTSAFQCRPLNALHKYKSSFLHWQVRCRGGGVKRAPTHAAGRATVRRWRVVPVCGCVCVRGVQILLVASAVLGSFAAWQSSPEDSRYDIVDDVSRTRVVLGGFCIFFGARLADGCTSGHGITGMGHLTLRSMIAVSRAEPCVPG